MSDLPLHHGRCDGFVRRGRVTAVSATSLTVSMPALSPGAIVAVERNDASIAFGEALQIHEDVVTCAPLTPTNGIVAGAPATSLLQQQGTYVGGGLLGNVVDAWGRGSNNDGATVAERNRKIALEERQPITRALQTGVAAIDAFATVGAGQRIALFAGAGVGKSTLLRQIAQRVSCDAQVFAFVGERAREVKESIEALRSGERWRSTTVVCATAAAPAVERLAALRAAQAQADWLCARGCDVLLAVDSLTRVANAWRELALAAGEPPAHRGHPASMVSTLASAVENAGARRCGSITGIYAVLVDGDDPFEPVSDAVRGLLDGHIMLARRLADAGRFPAIDVLRSSSRLMSALTSPEHRTDAALLRRALATLEDSADLLAIGAYKRGGDPWLDSVLELRGDMEAWLYPNDFACAQRDSLATLARKLRSAYGQTRAGA